MTPGELQTARELGVCGWPCHYGGVKWTQRAGSNHDLGWMWHCNRRTGGDKRCWQHRRAPRSLPAGRGETAALTPTEEQ